MVVGRCLRGSIETPPAADDLDIIPPQITQIYADNVLFEKNLRKSA
ncbi:hypothetical protein Halhy_6818 (plasmid) [Haliscomenobacter hydrossis DSM 1100]|uniref:Uncharacterized protein n=1 Tax=Haliscomenobacter hydrossis (strain ATCC 27775 / DSM 1100 / LMG 10767 / O) TaxID=760192 RepID=F4L8C2_HALH1|nr:hypothetical protein Halhy_6818 [Haliscomenobacter hydrossis DSM 1100]